MREVEVVEISTEDQLKCAVDMCYSVLKNVESSLYSFDAWLSYLRDGRAPMVCEVSEGRIVSAVLGRAESAESLIIGFVACEEAFRGKGITRELMVAFEEKAKTNGFKVITLGSNADGFYEKCGYVKRCCLNGQSIYQKYIGGKGGLCHG